MNALTIALYVGGLTCFVPALAALPRAETARRGERFAIAGAALLATLVALDLLAAG